MNDSAYIELLYLEEAAKEYLGTHPHISEEEAKTIVWARAGREL
jgi:hypothetical protein